MLVSGSLAPAPRVGAVVGTLELREEQSAPRRHSPRHSAAETSPRARCASRAPPRARASKTEERGSLDQPNERTSALKRARGGELAIVPGGPGGPTSGQNRDAIKYQWVFQGLPLVRYRGFARSIRSFAHC